MFYKVVITVIQVKFLWFCEYTEVYYLFIVFCQVMYKDEN